MFALAAAGTVSCPIHMDAASIDLLFDPASVDVDVAYKSTVCWLSHAIDSPSEVFRSWLSPNDTSLANSRDFAASCRPKHLDAVDRVVQYLYQTRYYAVEYGVQTENCGLQLAAKSLEFASDPSFGDNQDRKTSEGYISKLYGGPIDWKASKQKTVTTSTTEAELLALAEAGKTMGDESDHYDITPITIHRPNHRLYDYRFGSVCNMRHMARTAYGILMDI
ncbi:uncharacterized protein N7515_009083 [Penicillium bovifimosum]|uniref:Uncharacterized protein n=1 Tax=Penicillium bovifimosum TaxID=126998 RepID=A0A9W9GJY8_9EURO|nr:uncharacterized protein N7515_009083 [Penicillium bovifimosum]KAJ5121122.1 hypothetical protein N7515_009083 [Penicillium bovifimosum]